MHISTKHRRWAEQVDDGWLDEIDANEENIDDIEDAAQHLITTRYISYL